MAEEIEPIFTGDLNNPYDVELLKQFFGAEAINKAFSEGDGTNEILVNAAFARLLQKMEQAIPPEAHEMYCQMREMFDRQAAIVRQTRAPEPPRFTGEQMSLF